MLTSLEESLYQLLLGDISEKFDATTMPNGYPVDTLADRDKEPVHLRYSGSTEYILFLSLKRAARDAN